MPKIVRLPKKIQEVPIWMVYPDLGQPRQSFDMGSIAHLSNSIKRNGLLKPILLERISRERLRNSPGLENMLLTFDEEHGKEFKEINGVARNLDGCGDNIYLAVYGHRRFAAHWLDGILEIKAKVVKNLTPFQRLSLQLSEDSQEAIAQHEVAFDIVNIYRAKEELLRKETGRDEVNIPFTLLSYELGRSVKDITRAFQFNALRAKIQNAVDRGYSYAHACEIGRIRDKNLQMQVYRSQIKNKYNLTKLRGVVNDIVGVNDALLDPKVLGEVKELHGQGKDLDSLLRSFGRRATDELRGLLRLKSEGETGVLSEKAIEWVRAQTKGLDSSGRNLFFQRNRGDISRNVNAELTEQTLEGDLFGVPVKPEKSTYFIDERQRFYTLFDDLYKSLGVFVEFAKVDPKLLLRMKKEGLKKALKGFGGGLDDYVGVLVKDLVPAGESTAGKKGRNLFSREKYDPRINPSLKIVEIDLEKLVPDKNNVRKTYAKRSLEELAGNIAENGQLEELLVEKRPDGNYDIIVGHRRNKALGIAGMKKARCIVAKGLTAVDKLIIQITEDSQKPFSSSERAHSWYNHYKMHHAEMAEKGEGNVLSIPDFAKKIGKSASAVRAAFSYLSLPDKIKELVDSKVITYSVAVELSHIPCSFNGKSRDFNYNPDTDFYITPEQLFSGGENRYEDLQFSLALRAAHNGMTLKQAKAMVQNCNPNGNQARLFKQSALDKIVRDAERESIVNGLINKLGTFSGDLRGLFNGNTNEEKDYSENVYNHRTLRGKYSRLRDKFSEFSALVA
jgi:ParB/RepB/Spo0J family partition protein